MDEETVVARLETEINITHPKALEIQLKLYDIFLPILCSIVIPLNLLICLSSVFILRNKYYNFRGTSRSTYLFLGNISFSDLLVGTVTLAIQYCPDELQNEMVCCITVALHVCSTLVSIYSIGLIAIDRYLYILHGIYYHRLVSSCRARVMVLSLWLIAGIISFLPAFGLRNPTDNGKICWFIVLFPPKLVLFITILAMIPLVLIIVLYSIILKQALFTISYLHRASVGKAGTQVGDLRIFRGGLSSSRSSVDSLEIPHTIFLQEDREVPSQFRCCRKTNKPTINIEVYSANKWKAIKIVLLTTGAFFITWFPYLIAAMLYATCTDPDFCNSLLVAIARTLTLLGMCNSLLNPIIYAWWHNGFRESVKKIIHRLLGQRFQADEFRFSQTRRSTKGIISDPERRLHEEVSNIVVGNNSIPLRNENEDLNSKTVKL